MFEKRLLTTLNELAFSDKRPQKYVRHVLFWVLQYLLWCIITKSILFRISVFTFTKGAFRDHNFFIPDICYTYFVSYYLFKKFLEKKLLINAILSLTAVTLITYFLFLFLRFLDNGLFQMPIKHQLLRAWMYSMKFITNGPPVICAIFLSLKMLKSYYKKSEENLSLFRENANAELRMLKAQIHPHFLFNTLNNIYSFALSRSAVTEELVAKLHDTLNYMVNDCEVALISLEKELSMIIDYISLEKVRYNDQLRLDFIIKGDVSSKLIAPLLLIPFVENAFKHGASQVLRCPRVRLEIVVENDILSMKIINNKPSKNCAASPRSGVGLKNVRKRLQLLYPEKHELLIHVKDEYYLVKLQIPLAGNKNPDFTDQKSEKAFQSPIFNFT